MINCRKSKSFSKNIENFDFNKTENNSICTIIEDYNEISKNIFNSFNITLGFDDIELTEEKANKINSIFIQNKMNYRLEQFKNLELKDPSVIETELKRKDKFSLEFPIFNKIQNQILVNDKTSNLQNNLDYPDYIDTSLKKLENLLNKKRENKNSSQKDLDYYIDKFKKNSPIKEKISNKTKIINKNIDNSHNVSNYLSESNESINFSSKFSNDIYFSRRNKKFQENNEYVNEQINPVSFGNSSDYEKMEANAYNDKFENNSIYICKTPQSQNFDNHKKENYTTKQKNNKDNKFDNWNLNNLDNDSCISNDDSFKEKKLRNFKRDLNFANKINEDNISFKSVNSFERNLNKNKSRINKDFKFVKLDNHYINIGELNDKRILRDRSKINRLSDDLSVKSINSCYKKNNPKSCKSAYSYKSEKTIKSKEFDCKKVLFNKDEVEELIKEKFNLYKKKLDIQLKDRDKKVIELIKNFWNCVVNKIDKINQKKSSRFNPKKYNNDNDFVKKKEILSDFGSVKKDRNSKKISFKDKEDLNLKISSLKNNHNFIKRFKQLFELKSKNGDYDLNISKLSTKKFIQLKNLVDEIISTENDNIAQDIAIDSDNNLVINNNLNSTKIKKITNILDDSDDISSSLSDNSSKSKIFKFKSFRFIRFKFRRIY